MQVFLIFISPLVLAVLLFIAVVFNSHASTAKLELNGFYTLSADYSSKDQLLVGPRRGSKVNSGDNVTFDNSIIGAKVSYQINSNWDAVVQARAYVDDKDSLGSEISWAYLSHDLGQDNQVRAGLLQTPFLQGTELRSIGYARIWARPIIFDNGAGGFNEYTGIDYIQKYSSADDYWQWQIAAGWAKHDLEHIDGDLMALASIQYGKSNWWLRSAVTHIDYTLNRRHEQPSDDKVIMLSLEAFWALTRTEIHTGLSNSDSNGTPSDSMFYLSLSYPFEQHTPYIYFNWNDQDFSQSVSGNRPPPRNSNGLGPPGSRPPLPPGVHRPPPPPNLTNSSKRALAIGDRYDFTEGMAVKFHLEYINYRNKAGAESLGVSDDSVNISVSLEGVF